MKHRLYRARKTYQILRGADIRLTVCIKTAVNAYASPIRVFK